MQWQTREDKVPYRAQVGAFEVRGFAVANAFPFRERHLILDAIPNTIHLLATGLVGGYTSAESSSPSEPEPVMNEVTRILSAIEQGDPYAPERLLPLVYEELRKLAAHKLTQEKPGQTLQATALVHEAYLRLVAGAEGSAGPQHWHGRGHFFAAAAEAMRRILVEGARRKQRLKHGGGRDREHAEIDMAAPERPERLLALDEALDRLTAANGQAAELVKLRHFVGCSNAEAAALLGISPRKATQVWAYARAWLREELADDERT
jgi:RNA polymerase sigma factor (TIGR02999 family)